MQSKKALPSHLALRVETDFKASHSLEGLEVPHFHLWKVSVEFQAKLPLAQDRLIDLVFLQTVLDRVFEPLKGSYLNESLKASPTSENLALWTWEKIAGALPDAPLSEVKIELCSLDGVSTGSARIF